MAFKVGGGEGGRRRLGRERLFECVRPPPQPAVATSAAGSGKRALGRKSNPTRTKAPPFQTRRRNPFLNIDDIFSSFRTRSRSDLSVAGASSPPIAHPSKSNGCVVAKPHEEPANERPRSAKLAILELLATMPGRSALACPSAARGNRRLALALLSVTLLCCCVAGTAAQTPRTAPKPKSPLTCPVNCLTCEVSGFF